jgi:Uma2 family endonuclease
MEALVLKRAFSDVLLVVEVADTTGDYDRRIKVPRYARAGIPEVWIVGLQDRAIDVYRQAEGEEYREQRRVGPGESLVIAGVADRRIAVDEVFA